MVAGATVYVRTSTQPSVRRILRSAAFVSAAPLTGDGSIRRDRDFPVEIYEQAENQAENGDLLKALRATDSCSLPPPANHPDFRLDIIRTRDKSLPMPTSFYFESGSGKINRDPWSRASDWCTAPPEFGRGLVHAVAQERREEDLLVEPHARLPEQNASRN